jgi:hypothetical protein
MESLINKLIFHQWQRKLVALLTAAVIWILVSHSIISSKTIPSVPIRVINLPTDKTIPGLLPNGFLSKRTTLTLSGTKDVIDQLEPGDVEVILDVSNLPNDGVVQITKKNLVSLNPNINLPAHITSITHPDLVIKMSPILTEKIPITLHPPIGDSPESYDFLDMWPIHLTQTVSGPEEQVLNLKNQGLELTFNLSDISKEQLDALQRSGPYDDEVNFYVPDQWKKVHIPFSTRGTEAINDPEAKNLQLTFLRQQMLPIKSDLPIHVFYPLKNSTTLNPNTYGLSASPFVQFKNDIPRLTVPLYAYNVSKLFLEVVKDNIEIVIVAAPTSEREYLEWDVNFIDDTHLEDTYVAFLISNSKIPDSGQHKNLEREKFFRQRFRNYVQRFSLYLSPHHKLELQSKLEEGKIRVHVPNASLYMHRQEVSDAR